MLRLRGYPLDPSPELGFVGTPSGTIIGTFPPALDKIMSVRGEKGAKGDKGDTGDTGPQGRGYTSVTIDGNDLEFTPTTGPVEVVTVPALTQAATDAAAAAGSASAAAGSASAADTSRVLAEQAAEDAQNGIVPDGSVTVPKLATSTTTYISDTADARITAVRGAANGVAPLDAGSLIPSTYLPSYVDDVLEYANLAGFPASGEAAKIYVAVDTGKIYRWSGSAYVEISPSPGTTDAVPEGATNKYYTDARVTTQVQTMFGSSAGTVTQGNDSRLSDARTPTAHSHAQSDVTGLSTALAGKVDSTDIDDIVKITQAAWTALGSGRPSTRLYVIVG